MNGIEAAFIGRVGSEAELKTSQSGKPWTRISVCVGSGDDGQWVKVACFGEVAERLAGHVVKGDKLYVEGTLRLETWTDREGRERSGLSVAASKAEKLGAIGRNKPSQPKPLPEGNNHVPASAGGARFDRTLDDEIPF